MNVIDMLLEDGVCLDVAQRWHAVAAESKQLIYDHIDHCLDYALGASVTSSR
jgi:DNA-binding FrmR family transcriptional regulator